MLTVWSQQASLAERTDINITNGVLSTILQLFAVFIFSQVKKMSPPQQLPDQYVASWEPFALWQVC